jgi:anti-sigma B factor antagonist
MRPIGPPSVTMSRRDALDPTTHPAPTVIWVRGEHDRATRTLLEDALAQAVSRDDADVVVDLGGVTFMDGSTIGAISDGSRLLRARSRSLTVRGAPAFQRRLLDVCGLAFLIDERPSPTPAPAAPALRSWVAVPAADPDRAAAPSPTVPQRSMAEEPARRPPAPVVPVRQRQGRP